MKFIFRTLYMSDSAAKMCPNSKVRTENRLRRSYLGSGNWDTENFAPAKECFDLNKETKKAPFFPDWWCWANIWRVGFWWCLFFRETGNRSVCTPSPSRGFWRQQPFWNDKEQNSGSCVNDAVSQSSQGKLECKLHLAQTFEPIGVHRGRAGGV